MAKNDHRPSMHGQQSFSTLWSMVKLNLLLIIMVENDYIRDCSLPKNYELYNLCSKLLIYLILYCQK
jgi:hypothetical protein